MPVCRVHVCNNIGFSVWYYVPHTYVPGTWYQLVISRLPRYVYVYTYVPGWGTYYVPHMFVNWCEHVFLYLVINEIIHRKTEQLCHHRPRSKAHSNEYENNIHKAKQALPAWRGAGRSSRDTKPLLSSSDGARSCRIRLRFPLLFC